MQSIFDLPKDIHYHILRIYLSRDELYQYSETCKFFNENIKEIKNQSAKNLPYHLKITKSPTSNSVLKSMKMIKWAEEHENFCFDQESLTVAAINGDLDIFKYVYKYTIYEFSPYIYYEASKRGNFEIIKWCNNKNLRSNKYGLIGACEYGDLNIVKWMIKKEFPYNIQAINKAVRNEHYYIVKYLVENNFYWDSSTFVLAAGNRNTRIISYLYNKASHNLNYIGWLSVDAYCFAIEFQDYGDFRMLNWLKKHYCPMGIQCINTALEVEDYEVIQWLLNNRCPIYQELYYVLLEDKLIKSVDPEFLKLV